ncbi:MAG: SDR family oxidoreductase, partial [Pseudomonadota bacterium]
ALAGLEAIAAGQGRVSQAPPRRPEQALAPALVRAGDSARARSAAEAFLAGADPAWPADQRGNRLRLPAAPFTRQACRPDFAAAAGAAWLGPAVATPEGFTHALGLDAPDYWPLAEHRLHDAPVLVGMAWPGMAAAAARAAGLGPVLALKDLRWLRPLRGAEIAPGAASLAMQRNEGGWRAILGARTAEGGWQEYASATVMAAPAPAQGGDLAAIRGRCTQAAPLPEFDPAAGPITVSRRWDCRRQAWLNPAGDEALAELALPAEFSADRAAHPLHPALLDVAASLALDGPGPLPAGCALATIAGPLPAAVLAHVRWRRLDALTLEAAVTVYDPAGGAALMTMTGLRFVGRVQDKETPPLSQLVWRPAPLAGAAPAGPLVVVGEGALAQRLIDHLASQGLLAGASPSAAPDAGLLAQALSGQCAGLVLAPAGGRDLAWRAAAILRALLEGLARPLSVLVAGHGAYGLDAGDAGAPPDAALLAGLALAVAQEEPLLKLRYVDADPATPPAAVLAEFAAFGSGEGQPPLAMLRGGRRHRPGVIPLAAGDAAPAWPDHGCCVVTGGMGGFALTLAEEMASGGRVALALISRRGGEGGEPGEAAWRRERLAALAAAGVRVSIHACDVADRAQLSACLDHIRAEAGPITAVVHAAGVADGAFLVRRQEDEFQAALAAKVEGARHLDELTQGDPVRAFVLFSSLTGISGAPGQGAYAAANAYLDAFARWRRAQGRPALCIDWCALAGVGMAARSRFQSTLSVSAQGAAAIWRAALGLDLVQVVAAPAALMIGVAAA